MTATVIVSAEAEEQIGVIDDWWRENRPAAPVLFLQELAQATSTLEAMPFVGVRAEHPTVKGLRRILLKASRYHLYYVADPTTVVVLAIWSAVRGAGPDLQRRRH